MGNQIMNVNSGIYILLIDAVNSKKIRVGKLGSIYFKKGVYLYVGSAQRNLKKRIRRHLLKEKRKFWHIDYILTNESFKVTEIFIAPNYKKNYEEIFASYLEKHAAEIIPKFGSSDTKNKTHLFYFIDKESAKDTVESMFKNLNVKFVFVPAESFNDV